MLDSVEIDLLLEIGYGILTENMGTEQRDDFDAMLAKLSDREAGRVVMLARNAYGKMVPVSRERLEEIKGRNAQMSKIQATR